MWELFLKTGIILANFISVSTIPDVKEVLKINSSGFEGTVLKRLRISSLKISSSIQKVASQEYAYQLSRQKSCYGRC